MTVTFIAHSQSTADAAETRNTCWHTAFCWLLCRCHLVSNLRIYLHVLLIIIPVVCLAQAVALLIVGICRNTVIFLRQVRRCRPFERRNWKSAFLSSFLSLYFPSFAKLLVQGRCAVVRPIFFTMLTFLVIMVGH